MVDKLSKWSKKNRIHVADHLRKMAGPFIISINSVDTSLKEVTGAIQMLLKQVIAMDKVILFTQGMCMSYSI